MICDRYVSSSEGTRCVVETYLGHGELQAIIRDRVGSEHQRLEVQLLVTQDLPKRLPVMLLIFLAIVGSLCAARGDVHELQEAGLIRLQPAGRGRRVGEKEKAADSNDDGEDALEQEDPTPSFVATKASHLCDAGSK